MELTGIIAISGITGLSKIVAKTKNGLVVENVADNKRFAVQGNDKISALEDISIYTVEGEKPLTEVLKGIKAYEKGGQTKVSPKADPKELRAYFESVLPGYDAERVYNSDIKKVLNWYNILQGANLLIEKAVEEVKPAKEEKETASAETKAKPAKKAAAKKTKAAPTDGAEEKAKPAKKAAAKKAKAKKEE